MIETAYKPIPKGNWKAAEIKEKIESINDAMDYIIGVSGDYCASLRMLQERNIECCLDDFKVQTEGMGLLADLRQIRLGLESELADMEGEL